MFCLHTLYIYIVSNKYFVIISNSDRLWKQDYESSSYILVIDWNVYATNLYVKFQSYNHSSYGLMVFKNFPQPKKYEDWSLFVNYGS
jgi:hypothetical protein